MRQMQLFDYFNVIKKSSSVKVNENSKSLTQKCVNQKKTRKLLNSQLNTTKQVKAEAVKTRARRLKKMSSSKKPRYVKKAIIVISDDDDDHHVEPSSQLCSQESSQNIKLTQVLQDISMSGCIASSQSVTREYSLDNHQNFLNPDNPEVNKNSETIDTFDNDPLASVILTTKDEQMDFNESINPFENNYQDENINDENQKIDIKREIPIASCVESKKTPSIRVKSVSSINNSISESSGLKREFNSPSSQLSGYLNEVKNDDWVLTSTKSSQNLMLEKSSSLLKRPRDLSSTPDSFTSPVKKSQVPWKIKSPIKSPTFSQQSSPYKRKLLSPRKIFSDTQDKSIVSNAIENLNLFKQHVIVYNNFDINEVYLKGNKFIMPYGNMDAKTTTMYDFNDLNIPKAGCYREKDGERLFMAIVDVFSNSINPGYFIEDEIDKIFSILTLSVGAQILLSRMIKRKIRWTRRQDFDKEEIDGSIDAFLKELIDRNLLDSQCNNCEINVVLEMLSRDELIRVCKLMKVPHKSSKTSMIEMLLKLSAKKPLFSGMKTPRQALQEAVDSINGDCVIVSDLTIKLINMIITLLYPTQDPEKNISDAFFLLHEVHNTETKIFPKYPKTRYPIFSNRQHLLDYIEAKNQWSTFLKLIQQKNKDDSVWEMVRQAGDTAHTKLIKILNNHNEEFQIKKGIPSHIKRFMPIYIWGKILSSSVEGYKKLDTESINKAADILKFLIDNRSKIQGKFIKWYIELSQIEMNRTKNLEKSAEIVMEALAIPNISDADKNGLIERARMLSARSKNISLETKNLMKQQVELHADNFIFRPNEIIITAIMMQGLIGNKSTWQLEIEGVGTGYANVERVAIQYYMKNCGFTNGIHREGSFPVTLFTCLFWDEIYGVFVPGAFVCPYQPAPLDIFGSKFIENRDGQIQNKIQQFENINEEEFYEKMVNCYTTYRDYDCLITNIIDDALEFYEIIECLGKSGVIAICSKIASNLSVWQSGFPDLFLWNRDNKTCKIVEVKGPGDTLSVKQKLWIDYLMKNNVPVEVCHVQAANKYY